MNCNTTHYRANSSSVPGDPTIRITDVAQAAGVSATTVSHVLNGQGRVGPGARARVQAAAAQLGFALDANGRGDAPAGPPARSHTIGLVLPCGEGPEGSPGDAHFLLRLSVAAGDAALAADHGLLLLPAPRRREDLERFVLDGAILVAPQVEDRRLAAFDELGIPVVTLDRDPARPDRFWWVMNDNAVDLRRLLDHVADAGARRVALLSPAMPSRWVADAEASYAAWCARRGLAPLIARATRATAQEEAAALLDRSDRPDGIVALSDTYALTVLEEARQRWIAVPDELKVAAASDSPEALAAGLTGLDSAPEEQARAAVELLLGRFAGDATPRTRVIAAELLARATTARLEV